MIFPTLSPCLLIVLYITGYKSPWCYLSSYAIVITRKSSYMAYKISKISTMYVASHNPYNHHLSPLLVVFYIPWHPPRFLPMKFPWSPPGWASSTMEAAASWSPCHCRTAASRRRTRCHLRWRLLLDFIGISCFLYSDLMAFSWWFDNSYPLGLPWL